MSKADVLEQVRAARAELLDALAGLTEEEMVRPGAVGIWSVKDVLSHLVAWEAELVTALSVNLSRQAKHAPALLLIEDIDEWNAEQYHVSARRPLAAVLEDFHGVHRQLLSAIADLSEAALEHPLYFAWMEGEPLVTLIHETATWHEQEHAEDIRAWRAGSG